MEKLKNLIIAVRGFFAIAIYCFAGKTLRELFLLDAQAICVTEERLITYICALRNEPYRNILYYRVNKSGNIMLKLLMYLSKIVLPSVKSVEITGGVFEGGLHIVHNHCVIHANCVGKNLKVGPGVVIGKNKSGWPTVGDNVYVAAHATVLGDITIGDNVIIGAGAVVMHDIPANTVYVGNPAHMLRENKSDV